MAQPEWNRAICRLETTITEDTLDEALSASCRTTVVGSDWSSRATATVAIAVASAADASSDISLSSNICESPCLRIDEHTMICPAAIPCVSDADDAVKTAFAAMSTALITTKATKDK